MPAAPSSPPGRPDVELSRAERVSERRPWYDLGFNFTPRQAFILLGLLACGVALSYALDLIVSRFVTLDREDVAGWIEGFGILGPLVFIALLASTIIFSPLPSVPVDIAAGLAFGLVPGTVYVIIGAMIGATVNFYLARGLGRHFVERKLGKKAMGQVDEIAERAGFKLIFIMRLIPLFSFDWVSYAAGLTTISYRAYALASVLGSLLPAIAIVYVGDALLTHPGRSRLVFSGLVVWSAIPPVAFLVWVGMRALHRRARGRNRPSSGPATTEDAE